MTIPVNIYSRHSNVIFPFIDSYREQFAETENFMAFESAHLESVRQYRYDLKARVEDIKHVLNLQLDSMFGTLNEKTMQIEDTILTNIANFKENLDRWQKTESLVFDLTSSVD